MHLPLALLLVIPGLLLLATPALPLGVALIVAGWWVYERNGPRRDDRFIALLMILGSIGAMAVFLQWAWQRITSLL